MKVRPDPFDTLGKRFKAVRMARGYSLDDIGRKLGISASAVQQIEGGKTVNPRRQRIELFAKMTGVSASWLLLREGKDPDLKPLPTHSRSELVTLGRQAVREEAAESERSHLEHSIAVLRRGLSRAEAAMYIGVSRVLFDKLVRLGQMPRPKIISSKHVWDIRELDVAFDELPDEQFAPEQGRVLF